MSISEREFETDLRKHNTIELSPDWLLPVAKLVEEHQRWGCEVERAKSLFDQCMVLVKTSTLKDGKLAPQWKVCRLYCVIAPSFKGDKPVLRWEAESFSHEWAVQVYERNLVLSREQLLA